MIRPLGDRIVLRQIDPEVVTTSGIVIPDSAQTPTHRGFVLAIGEGKLSEMTGRPMPPKVEPGDEVLFSKYGGTEVEVDGETLMIVRCDDLLGVCEPADAVLEAAA